MIIGFRKPLSKRSLRSLERQADRLERKVEKRLIRLGLNADEPENSLRWDSAMKILTTFDKTKEEVNMPFDESLKETNTIVKNFKPLNARLRRAKDFEYEALVNNTEYSRGEREESLYNERNNIHFLTMKLFNKYKRKAEKLERVESEITRREEARAERYRRLAEEQRRDLARKQAEQDAKDQEWADKRSKYDEYQAKKNAPVENQPEQPNPEPAKTPSKSTDIERLAKIIEDSQKRIDEKLKTIEELKRSIEEDRKIMEEAKKELERIKNANVESKKPIEKPEEKLPVNDNEEKWNNYPFKKIPGGTTEEEIAKVKKEAAIEREKEAESFAESFKERYKQKMDEFEKNDPKDPEKTEPKNKNEALKALIDDVEAYPDNIQMEIWILVRVLIESVDKEEKYNFEDHNKNNTWSEAARNKSDEELIEDAKKAVEEQNKSKEESKPWEMTAAEDISQATNTPNPETNSYTKSK